VNPDEGGLPRRTVREEGDRFPHTGQRRLERFTLVLVVGAGVVLSGDDVEKGTLHARGSCFRAACIPSLVWVDPGEPPLPATVGSGCGEVYVPIGTNVRDRTTRLGGWLWKPALGADIQPSGMFDA
jgi:hypothetical protein